MITQKTEKQREKLKNKYFKIKRNKHLVSLEESTKPIRNHCNSLMYIISEELFMVIQKDICL